MRGGLFLSHILEARSQTIPVRVKQIAAREQMMIYNEEDASMPAVREDSKRYGPCSGQEVYQISPAHRCS
eukprot:3305105-Amphidinium_carterae.1